MKTILLAVALLAAAFIRTSVGAEDVVDVVAPARPARPAAQLETRRLPGVDLAEGISQLTGVAISPLLGMTAVGAWQYFHASEAGRGHLPWYCLPYVWGTGFCLLGLCFLKDLFGAAAPPLVKKPLDVAELFENKLSALVACGAFVPFVVSEMARHAPPQTVLALLPDVQAASVFSLGGMDAHLLSIPLAVLGFLLVWLVSHAITVLIALCPFGFIDAVLKLLRTMILSSVVLTSLVSPSLGALVSLAILFLAGLLAPWAFRLSVFGTLFGLDVLWPGRGRRLVRVTEPHAFLARSIAGTPVRTYGRLARAADGSVIFAYRPWIVMPERSVAFPPGNVAIAKGLLFPSLLHRDKDQQSHRIVVILLPRYRLHEQSIASHFEIVDIRQSLVVKGFRAVRCWLSDTVRPGKSRDEPLRDGSIA